MKTYILDRIEGTIAICENEDGRMEKFPLNQMPEGANDGSVLHLLDNGVFELDLMATAKRRREMETALNQLYQRSRK